MPQVQGQSLDLAGKSDDADLIRRALGRDGSAFRTIMQTHNRRLYRIAAASFAMTAKPRTWFRKPMSAHLVIWKVSAATPVSPPGLPASS